MTTSSRQAFLRQIVPGMPSWARWVLLMGVAVLVFGSLALGVRDALLHSNDFQWSPSRLMWQGTNPYLAHLAGDREHIILDQAPNYGHLLYILLWPFAMLSWDWAKPAWALANLLMLGHCVQAFWSKLPQPSQRLWWLVAVALMCVGYPVKITLGNGQQAMLCLFGLTLLMQHARQPWLGGLGLAILVTKYTFGVPVGAALLLLGCFGTVAVGAALSIAGWLFLSFWTHTSPLDTLLLPMKVASQDVPVSFFDLLSVFRILEREQLLAAPGAMRMAAGAILAVNAAFFAVVWWRRRALLAHPHGLTAALAGAALMSLGTIYHLGYDLVVTLFWAGALLLLRPTVGRAYKLSLLAMFLVYWSLPRVAKFLPVNPLNLDWMVALLALGLIAEAFRLVLSIPQARQDMGV